MALFEKISKAFEIKKNPAERIVNLIGMKYEDFAGKLVLDAGAGRMALERGLKEAKVNSKVVSFDYHTEQMEKYRKPDSLIVQGDMYEGLPFKDSKFDLIICVGGPMGGGTLYKASHDSYLEGMRVIKDGGEIRIANPIHSVYGIAAYLDEMYKEGKLPQAKNQSELLEPISSKGMNYWLDIYNSLPQHLKDEFENRMVNDVKKLFEDSDYDVSVSYVKNKDSAYLLLRKNGMKEKNNHD